MVCRGNRVCRSFGAYIHRRRRWHCWKFALKCCHGLWMLDLKFSTVQIHIYKGPILYLFFWHCHIHVHNDNQQCSPSSSVQSYRINIAKALWLWLWQWLWREKQYMSPLLDPNRKSCKMYQHLSFLHKKWLSNAKSLWANRVCKEKYLNLFDWFPQSAKIFGIFTLGDRSLWLLPHESTFVHSQEIIGWLNPNWHEGGHFPTPVLLDQTLSVEFLSNNFGSDNRH